MINIDFLLAGCNTRCRHCYVNGGPGKMMPVEDALNCIERLDALAVHLTRGVSFTLDHEPINHPCIAQIIRAAADTRHVQNYHHGMTTGIALMGRADRETVMRTYLDCGYDGFGITLHGGKTYHDMIVRRDGAWEKALAAAEYIKASGCRLEVSLMLNRHFLGEAEEITSAIDRIQPDCIALITPIFTPHRNMMDFEPYRASLEDAAALEGCFEKWGLNKDECLNNATQCTVSCAIKRLENGPDLPALFEQPQDELYLTLHPDCMLYVGNSGAETQCLGDLRSINIDETAQIIASLPGNRDYTAFYDVDDLPEKDALIGTLEKLSAAALYGDFESVIYRGLAEMGIPTRIIE